MCPQGPQFLTLGSPVRCGPGSFFCAPPPSLHERLILRKERMYRSFPRFLPKTSVLYGKAEREVGGGARTLVEPCAVPALMLGVKLHSHPKDKGSYPQLQMKELGSD